MNNPNEGGGGSSSSSGVSVLSAKVARGLAVRTDTPAMKAALEALSSSLGNKSSNSVNNYNQNDSRAVRTAIEQDALQQALALQDALEQIVQQVAALRQDCSQMARTATACKNAIHESVVTTETANIMLPKSKISTEESKQEVDELAGAAVEPEEKLAGTLHSAFVQRDLARQRLNAVHEFLEKFDLSAADDDLLTNYNFAAAADNNDETNKAMAFLQALQRTRKIRAALSTSAFDSDDTGNLGAGSALRMLENLSNKQERAYERLYQYLQKYLVASEHHHHHNNNNGKDDHNFKNSNNNTNDDDTIDERLQQDFVRCAVYELRHHVPAFYSHCIELVAASRRATVTRRFLLALTAGPAPIEMKAHDSVAYVGDMLAFAFRAFSVEADLATGLLDFKPQQDEQDEKDNKEANDDNAVAEDESEEYYNRNYKAIGSTEMLSIALSGLVRPLKSRILQVVSTLARRPDDENKNDDHDDDSDQDDDDDDGLEHETARTRLTHLYEICGLLLFYSSRVSNSVDKMRHDSGRDVLAAQEEKNPLVSCLIECLAEAETAYEATIRVYAAMLDQMGVLTGDSEASIVHDLLIVLADVRMSSPGFSANIETPKETLQQQRILSIEWVAETLVTAALGSCKTLEDVVYLKQALTASKRAGMSIADAEKLDEEIEGKETALIDELVARETSQVLDLCGLGGLTEAWKSWKEVKDSGQQDLPMASYPGLSPADVESAITEFYSSLYSPPLPSLESVKDVVTRKTARTKIADNVCEMYAFLYDAITTSDGGYSDTSFLGHTPEQVNTLFSV